MRRQPYFALCAISTNSIGGHAANGGGMRYLRRPGHISAGSVSKEKPSKAKKAKMKKKRLMAKRRKSKMKMAKAYGGVAAAKINGAAAKSEKAGVKIWR